MTFNPIQKILKKNTTSILIMSLIIVMMGIGSCATVPRTTLQDRTMSISLGQRSTWEHQTLDRRIESFTISGRHARQIKDLTECATLRTDGLDFSFMASSETVNLATTSKDSRFGVLSKTGADAKKMFTDKIVPISINYPFFFKPIQDGMERPKTELSYKIPSRRLTRNAIKETYSQEEFGQGLDTTIDWKNTGDNSYDGEKLQLLVHDESGKWERPDNILNNWRVTKTCLRLGARVVGKCMMGSTSNALNKGGDNFKKLFYNSDVTNRNRNGQTTSGLYSLFIPMEWGYEGFIDKYGYPVFDSPSDPIEGIDGEKIFTGVIDHWENEVEGLKRDSDALNEYYRQFPRSEKHAFRDETVNSLFNLTKIYRANRF